MGERHIFPKHTKSIDILPLFAQGAAVMPGICVALGAFQPLSCGVTREAAISMIEAAKIFVRMSVPCSEMQV